MRPSQVSAELRRIASEVERCSTPVRRDLVRRDLRKVLMAVCPEGRASDNEQTAVWEASDEILEAMRTRSLDPFRYEGPSQRWIHMVHVDNEEDEFPGNPLLKVNNEISVSSFSPSIVFPVEHAGRKGYVLHGKPSYHFPFDSNSVRDITTGERQFGWETVDFEELAELEEHPEWDEAWLNPSESRLVGYIWASDARTLDEFESDSEGMAFLSQSPTGSGFVRLADGSLHDVTDLISLSGEGASEES